MAKRPGSYVRDIGRGIARIAADVRVMTKMAVSVGVHGDAGETEGTEGRAGAHKGRDFKGRFVRRGVVYGGTAGREGTPIVVVAASNEFGTSDGRVPERSFIRSTVDEELPNLKLIRDRVVARVVEGTLRPRQAIGLLGAYLQGKIRAKIDSNVPPPNAPSTIAAKGSSHTLIDTGNLKQAITFEVHEDGFTPSE